MAQRDSTSRLLLAGNHTRRPTRERQRAAGGVRREGPVPHARLDRPPQPRRQLPHTSRCAANRLLRSQRNKHDPSRTHNAIVLRVLGLGGKGPEQKCLSVPLAGRSQQDKNVVASASRPHKKTQGRSSAFSTSCPPAPATSEPTTDQRHLAITRDWHALCRPREMTPTPQPQLGAGPHLAT